MENLNKKIGYIIVLTFWLIVISLISSCGLTYTQSSYDDHHHITYHEDQIYFGYYSGFYYYYGVPHYYPWWYYYVYRPSFYYHTNTHVHIHCSNGLFVYGHRKNKLNNKYYRHYKNVDVKPTSIRNSMPNNEINNKFIKPNRNSNILNIIKPNNTNRPNRTNNKINNKIKVNNNGSKRPNKTNTSRK